MGIKGNNLLLLANIDKHGKVLIMGSSLSEWREEFVDISYVTKNYDFSTTKKYDLILIHSTIVKTKREFKIILNKINGVLKPNGSIFLFAKNFFSLQSLISLKNRDFQNLTTNPYLGFPGYKKIIKESKYNFKYHFLAIPSITNTESYVNFEPDQFEIPHYFKDGFLFIFSNNKIEDNGFLKKIRISIKEYLQKDRISLNILQFDLRDRGAIILNIFEEYSNKKFIIRIVSDAKINNIVKKNHEILNVFQADKNITSDIKTLLPIPIKSTTFNKNNIYIENTIDGILAWKIKQKTIQNVILYETKKFIYRLGINTRRKKLIAREIVDKQFDEYLKLFKNISFLDNDFYKEIIGLTEKIKISFLNSEIYFVTSHGDYGYGNILVNPKTGRIQGVIDWDTCRLSDFPAIDIINMKIQLERVNNNFTFFNAFKAVVILIMKKKKIDDDFDFEDSFNIKKEFILHIIYITFLRYMARSAQYHQILESELQEYKKSFEWFMNTYSLANN